MVNLVTELSKYLMIILIAVYTLECFSVFGYQDEDQRGILRRQNVIMFMIHFIGFLILYLNSMEQKILIFYVMQVALLLAIILLYRYIYPKASRLVVNNMCMLLAIGFVMLTRLSYSKAWAQFIIVCGSAAISLVVPVIIRKMKVLEEWRWIYVGIGLAALGAVLILAGTSGGAKLGFDFGFFSIQPSEFVKIVFVFFVAASLNASSEFKNVVITTIFAALHVLLLVASTDLGSALILFVVYLVMLYVATRQPLYMLAGLAGGSLASVAAYHLFGHVRTRVMVWQDPLASYDNAGMQVTQSLFAIGTGSWFGLGLCQGAPQTIPVAAKDFIFSAIAEELGLIFALCMMLVCLSCYVMFLNIAMQLHNKFYKLVALGLGTSYIFQSFLTIGGATKFIPSTGVTLPLVSYGGSSMLSTWIMFGIIQGLYILREDEEEIIERKKQQKLKSERQQRHRQSAGESAGLPRRRSSTQAPQAKTRRTAKGTAGSARKTTKTR